MSKDELYAEAKHLEIAGRSKMTKAELENAIAKAKRLDSFAEEVFEGVDAYYSQPTNRVERRKRRKGKPLAGLIDGKPMPLHYRGRAMGAKHYAELRGE